MLVWLALQVMAGPPAPARVDVRAPVRPLACPADEGETIVVCGHGAENPDRLKRLSPPQPEAAPPRAAVALGNGASVSAEADAADVPGAGAKRVMVRLRLPF